MIDIKKSGRLVRTKDGKMGRTINEKGIINGKIPVYLCTKEGTHKDFPGERFPLEFSDKAILCDPKTLTAFGFID
jgi:hypothetical protein